MEKRLTLVEGTDKFQFTVIASSGKIRGNFGENKCERLATEKIISKLPPDSRFSLYVKNF